ncbi:MAG: T3SS regulon transcriptional activator ExsA [Saprospiraceae bacterium]
MLRKQSEVSLLERQSYLSLHAFTMVVSGEQKIETDEGQLNIKAGKMAFLRKGIYTINDLISQGGSFESYLLFFDDDFLKAFFRTFSYGSKVAKDQKVSSVYKLTTPAYLTHFWQSIPYLPKSDHPNGTHDLFLLKAQEYMTVLLTQAPALIALLQSIHQSKLHNLQLFMERHYDKPLTIEDYAALSGRSPSTFRRTFKLKFGTSPRQWIIQKRMKKALKLLQQTDLDVTQIALEVGYENTSHFISAFKKIHGQTPKAMGKVGLG